MLIKVFGIWLMAANINHLIDYTTTCEIQMNATAHYRVRYPIDKTCDEVAAEINRQIKRAEGE